MSDLKETKEFVVGSIALTKVIISELSDGFQSSDLIDLAKKLASDEEFRNKVWEAAKGAQHIPAELKAAPTLESIAEIGAIVLDALKA